MTAIAFARRLRSPRRAAVVVGFGVQRLRISGARPLRGLVGGGRRASSAPPVAGVDACGAAGGFCGP
eukprot:4918054-Lingulodinium_polyedra.AAC.1